MVFILNLYTEFALYVCQRFQNGHQPDVIVAQLGDDFIDCPRKPLLVTVVALRAPAAGARPADRRPADPEPPE